MSSINEPTTSAQANQPIALRKDLVALSGVDLTRKSSLVKEFVLVDGLGRSGKGMIGHILASMDRVEKVRLDLGYDTCHRLYRLGKITHDAAVCMLKIEADLGLYNNYIGREVNFRFSDMSGIWANTRPFTYIRRLFSEEGAPAVQRIRQERPIFQSLSHDALQSANLFFDAFGDRLRFIHVVRDPVDIIYEWVRRGFGDRIGIDGQEVQLTREWGDEVVPLYAIGWEDEYLSITPTERVIKMVQVAFDDTAAGYAEMTEDRQSRVRFLLFDEFVVNPNPWCQELAGWLETTTTGRTKRRLKKEQCPRTIPEAQRPTRVEGIRTDASSDYMEILEEQTEKYREVCSRHSLESKG
jgi:hypothetical protein